MDASTAAFQPDGLHLVARATATNSSQSGTSNSVSTLVSTFVPLFLFAFVSFGLFVIFRRLFPRNYRPRTFMGSLKPHERSPNLPTGLFNWYGAFFNIPDTYVLNHHTLDGYLFLRLLKVLTTLCLVGCAITWPILFPINATGGGGHSQLDLLTFANVTNNYYRMFAHAGCAIIYFSVVIYTITRESIYYINLRQAYLMSPYYASRISSRTVLFTSVPQDYLNEGKLRAMLGSHVVRVWFPTDTKVLDDKVKQRDKAAMKLEGAETKLIVTANGKRIKAEGKNHTQSSEEEALGYAEAGSSGAQYLDPKKRPTHRTGLLGLIGKKVDSIDWCRNELQKLVPEVNEMQTAHMAGDAKKVNSVFVEFDNVAEAQSAYQSLAHHQVLHMSPRFAGIQPGQVIWSNLRIIWWERVVRQIVTVSIVIALIIFWSIPVAFVGSISNINYLTTILPWLSFINSIPHVILGVVTGLLPSVLLSVLMALLPIFLRLMAKVGGDMSLGAVELTVQNFYFGFQVVQVFLVATLGSAASAVVPSIVKNPSSAPGLLAAKIPLASNFYLSYMIVQGLGIVSGLLLSLVGLLIFFVLGKFLDKTPRKQYKRWINLSGVSWGTVFPVYTNLFVIALCYAAIAPLVLGFAAIGIYLFYFAYRYNLLFVANAAIDTKGRVYPRALQQLFVGLYVAEVCLIGLFAIATGKSIGALGPLILMILFLIFTALYQVSLNAALTPLIEYLPKSLDAEERRLLELEHGELGNGHGNRALDNGEDGLANKEAQAHERGANNEGPAPHKRPNFITKWLRPDIYTDYATMRRLVPKEIDISYEPEAERNAYFSPSVISRTPLLWIPRDTMGISRHEVRDTSKVIPITDEAASLDQKNKVIWDAQDGRPPIYLEVPYY